MVDRKVSQALAVGNSFLRRTAHLSHGSVELSGPRHGTDDLRFSFRLSGKVICKLRANGL
ncbi:MAG: hypothetical protein RLZZ436_1513 [Planctomycetota bacterium]